MNSAKKLRPKVCKICKNKFTPAKSLQLVCNHQCAIQYARQHLDKLAKKRVIEERRQLKQRKAALKPLSHWLRMTQRVFNDYIRERDKNDGCISCGSKTAITYHAGHYRTTASASQIRFNENNCHKQCSACNTHKSGSISEYRIGLSNKIGINKVIELENNNEIIKYTPEILKEIRNKYRKKIKEL
ncbi:recombination protein NinG [Arsenophonus nasoniae]|uniref:Recombination protein NinG n=1 Tax=Arsenophonus nasoniae TaxID=638 RepID=A0AA95GBY3_9GAMM|nr:recombination protein NinG [Arsenophonus nasoniae]WGL93788.1 recombination protein NinG [Arsenophonus nasoniae]WGL96000.1 recombination protein NinG [Arsenophonus nasoniae]